MLAQTESSGTETQVGSRTRKSWGKYREAGAHIRMVHFWEGTHPLLSHSTNCALQQGHTSCVGGMGTKI